MSKINRIDEMRGWQKTGLTILLLSFFLFAFGSVPLALPAEKGPIKIGFFATLTGNSAQLGMDMVDGIKMRLAEENYTVAGRKIELIVEDEQNPSVALTKAQKMIQHDKVHMMAGALLANVALALGPICTEAKIPYIVTQASGDDITQRKRSPYVLRTGQTGGEAGHIAGDYAFKKLGWRKAATIAMDYNWGQESAGGFHKVFEDLGGKVIQKIWTPLTAVDYAPYVANLDREADGVYDCVSGAASIRLLKELRQQGFTKVIGAGPITDETFHEAIGDDGVGVYSTWPYSIAQTNPEMVQFRERARKYLKGKEPTGYQAMQYCSIDWIIRALKQINGNAEDTEAFLRAMKSIEIPNSIRGPLKMDKYGHPIQNMYVRRMDKVGSGYQNTVVETYPAVTQFYHYNPEEFLKEPVYSRDYPPCKNCKSN